MGIKTLEPQTANDVLRLLGSFAVGNEDYIFRGHTHESYRLQSTLQRAHGSKIHENWNAYYDEMLCRYESGLARIGKLPNDIVTKRDILEHARHHGLPSPCIDFSYSPYVALFFALSGLSEDTFTCATERYATIYAVNIFNLGWAYTKLKRPVGTTILQSGRMAINFVYPYNEHFKSTEDFNTPLPSDVLSFMPFPAKFNQRMQRQCGCFIYDTLNYNQLGLRDLEDFIKQVEEPETINASGQKEWTPTLTIIRIPLKQTAKELLSHLELIGILGMFMYDSPEGVASDIANSYFYDSKTLSTRDRLEKKS